MEMESEDFIRREDRSIDLISTALKVLELKSEADLTEHACLFLHTLESLWPIRSRQTAALAIAAASRFNEIVARVY